MRVFLIDDHALFRAGLESLLTRHGIDVVAHSRDGVENLERLPDLAVDIILLDMRLGETSGTSVLDGLNNAGNRIPVVALTTSREEKDLLACLHKGARGYLLKDMEPDQLVAALSQVQAGETAIAPEMTSMLARALQSGATEQQPPEQQLPFSELTPREREILTHLADGQSNKLIARELGISDGTVKLHVKAVLRKLGVHSRVEAAVLAVEHGLRRTQFTPTV